MTNVNAPMMVVRKRLATTEVSDPDFRTEDGVVQRTNDGGITWVDSPANDVRHGDAWRLPPILADDQRCQAAANMTRFFSNWLEELLPILGAAGSGWALLSTLILLFVVLGPFALVIIMLDVAATLLGIGAGAIGSAFTNEVYDTLTCIFYCSIGDDGQVSAEQLETINVEVDAQIGGIAAIVLHLVFALVGEVGVSNWGTVGEAPADCDDCACCEDQEVNFAGGTPPSGAFELFAGNWDSGHIQQVCTGGFGSTSTFNFGVIIGSINCPYTRVEADIEPVVLNATWYLYGLNENDPTTGDLTLLGTDTATPGAQTIGVDLDGLTGYYGIRLIVDTATGCGSGDCFCTAVRIFV